MEDANTKHDRIMGEKNAEFQDLKQKYSELENQYNEQKNENEYFIEHFDRALSTAVKNKISEKDQEIQRLQKQINQLLSQQGSQVTEMEEEIPKIKPESIEIEENKEEVIPRHGMQTRSQGPPSFGEKIQQEVYDPVGNLVSKRTGYMVPNLGEYGAYDVVVNLINYYTGKYKTFKDNFVTYAQEKEMIKELIIMMDM